MIDHPRCATCRHWTDVLPSAHGRVGECSALGLNFKDFTGRTAILTWQGVSAELRTRPDHYCPMHSDLTDA